jgi:hypothetical protein
MHTSILYIYIYTSIPNTKEVILAFFFFRPAFPRLAWSRTVVSSHGYSKIAEITSGEENRKKYRVPDQEKVGGP